MGADIFEGLIEGRIVHYVMGDGQHRPAIIVRVWDQAHVNGCVNLTIFTDWTNDSSVPGYGRDANCAAGKMWRTSILFDDNKDPSPGTWHWIERA